VHWPFNGSENEALLCVFDGHGKNGERVADLVMNELPSLLQERAAELRAEPKKTLITAVEQIDSLVLARDGGEFAKECGTTSTVLYINGCTIWSACSGDSRAVMGSTKGGAIVARDLSVDCKPDMDGARHATPPSLEQSQQEFRRVPGERERLEAAGGMVLSGTRGRTSRVFTAGGIGLAMSRSIGDPEVCRATTLDVSSRKPTRPLPLLRRRWPV